MSRFSQSGREESRFERIDRPMKIHISIFDSFDARVAEEPRLELSVDVARTVCLLLPLFWTDFADDTDDRGTGAPAAAGTG